MDVDRAFVDDCSGNDAEPGNVPGPCHILARSWQDGTSPEIVNRLREPPYRDTYCDLAREFVTTLYNPEAMTERIEQMRTRNRVRGRFDGTSAPSLDDLMWRDPLWTPARFQGAAERYSKIFVPQRHEALLEQLATCEVTPLVDN